MKCSETHNVISFLNNLIVKLIDEECLKERNEKLILMSKKKNYKDKKKKNKKRNVDNVRYITHDSCAISVMSPFNRL